MVHRPTKEVGHVSIIRELKDDTLIKFSGLNWSFAGQVGSTLSGDVRCRHTVVLFDSSFFFFFFFCL